jgi:methyl-accepting chemotaxis protein
MKWYHNLNIRIRLLSGFIIVAIIAGVIGFIGIQQINKIVDRDALLYENMTVPLSQISNMSTLFQQIRVEARDIILAEELGEIQRYANEIKQLREEFSKESDVFKTTIISQEVTDAYNQFLTTRQEYAGHLDQLIALAIENKDEEAMALLNGNMKKSSDIEQAAIDKLVELKIAHAKETAVGNTNIANAATIQMETVLIIGMILAIGFGIFISRGITKPINILRHQLDTLAENGGDLTQEIKIESKDEIGGLAQAVNKFIANLRVIMLEVNKSALGLSSTSQQLTASAEQTASGANETSATMSEIATTVDEISKNLQDIGRITDNNAQIASDGNKGMISFNKDMVEIDKATQLVSAVIDDLNQDALNINQIVDAITNIADQTNLLALNAAIEAARAGEAGKGFAVVAEEVRKLAEECSQSAKNIKDLIKAMQDKASEAVHHVSNSNSMVVVGMDKSVELGGVFQEIANSVEGIGEQFQSLAAATEQMSAGVQNVAASTQEQTAATEEVSAAAESLSKLAGDLSDIIGKFKI